MKEKNKSNNTPTAAEPSTSSSQGGEDQIWKDPRFAHFLVSTLFVFRNFKESN